MNRSSCAASDSGVSGNLPSSSGRPAFGIAGNAERATSRCRVRMWSVINSGPVAQFMPDGQQVVHSRWRRRARRSAARPAWCRCRSMVPETITGNAHARARAQLLDRQQRRLSGCRYRGRFRPAECPRRLPPALSPARNNRRASWANVAAAGDVDVLGGRAHGAGHEARLGGSRELVRRPGARAWRRRSSARRRGPPDLLSASTMRAPPKVLVSMMSAPASR